MDTTGSRKWISCPSTHLRKAHNMSMKEKNPDEGMELAAKCEIKYKTKPDFGAFDFVYVYPISELEDYYGV